MKSIASLEKLGGSNFPPFLFCCCCFLSLSHTHIYILHISLLSYVTPGLQLQENIFRQSEGLEVSHFRSRTTRGNSNHTISSLDFYLWVCSISSKTHHFPLNSWSRATQSQQDIFATDRWNDVAFESSVKSIVHICYIHVPLNPFFPCSCSFDTIHGSSGK